MNAYMFFKSQFNFFVWRSHAQKSMIEPLVPPEGSATPTRSQGSRILARPAANHSDVPEVRQVLVGSRRHPQAATIYDTSAPVADRQTLAAIPSIPLIERRIRVLHSPPHRLPSTKKGRRQDLSPPEVVGGATSYSDGSPERGAALSSPGRRNPLSCSEAQGLASAPDDRSQTEPLLFGPRAATRPSRNLPVTGTASLTQTHPLLRDLATSSFSFPSSFL